MAAKKNPLADKAYELYKDGMKLVDIADQLGKPEGTIRDGKIYMTGITNVRIAKRTKANVQNERKIRKTEEADTKAGSICC